MSEPAGQGDLFVVSAPSGSGKTTLCRRLLADLPDICFSISHTTRAARTGETEGVDYYFVDRREFDTMREQGSFLEWAVVGGELYGTAAAAVRAATHRGLDVLLDIDTQGAGAIRRLVPGAILIFILPPGRDALRQRLAGRGSEPTKGQMRRLSLARGEIQKASMYDYTVINDDVDRAYERLRSIVVASRCRRERQTARVRAIAADFGISGPDRG